MAVTGKSAFFAELWDWIEVNIALRKASEAPQGGSYCREYTRDSTVSLTRSPALSPHPGNQADLVFLDIQIPGLDGFQVLRSLPKSGFV